MLETMGLSAGMVAMTALANGNLVATWNDDRGRHSGVSARYFNAGNTILTTNN
jgi:hypothetical protein